MNLGHHYLIESEGVDPRLLDDPAFLKQICVDFCAAAGVTILHTHFHKFSPQGVTGIIVIAESHLAIHTWPECGACCIDYYSCKKDLSKQDPSGFFAEALKPTTTKTRVISRGE